MRSPVSRIAAAVVFVVALGGVAVWFHGGGTTFAFADFAKPILEAKTARFTITTDCEVAGRKIKAKAKVMVLGVTRSRQEIESLMPGESKMKSVMIFDWDKGRSLTLEPLSKKAFVLTMNNMPKGKMPIDKDPLGWLRMLLTDARDKPEMKRESLGEKEIDGRRVVGFRLNAVNGTVMSLWGDPKTGLPVRAEVSMGMFNNAMMTLSDFEFNVEMDESLFSTDPPAGYTVQDMGKVDLSPAEEKDLIETLREYSSMKQPKKPLPKKGHSPKSPAAVDEGGLFPDTLDLMAIIQIVAEKFVPEMGPKPSDEQMRKMSDAQIRLQRGVLFVAALPPEADAHYAGKGVKFGAADKPVFWYRPKDAKKYRVIYGDMSVREADAAPNVAGAQALPEAGKAKK